MTVRVCCALRWFQNSRSFAFRPSFRHFRCPRRTLRRFNIRHAHHLLPQPEPLLNVGCLLDRSSTLPGKGCVRGRQRGGSGAPNRHQLVVCTSEGAEAARRCAQCCSKVIAGVGYGSAAARAPCRRLRQRAFPPHPRPGLGRSRGEQVLLRDARWRVV